MVPRDPLHDEVLDIVCSTMYMKAGRLEICAAGTFFTQFAKTWQYHSISTRIHSSRMRTVRCSGSLSRGVSAWPGGVCLPGHGRCTPSPRGQTDTCENITFADGKK